MKTERGPLKKTWLASGFAALLLIGFVCNLLGMTYRSQQHLQKTAMIRLQENLAGQAQAEGYFILERRNDIRNMASSSTTEAYFLNKALGMSMEYGLIGSLNNIVSQFRHLNDSSIVNSGSIYARLALFSLEGDLLAAYHNNSPKPILKDEWEAVSRNGTCDVTVSVDRLNPGFLLFTAPVLLQNKIVGHMAGWVSLTVIHERFMKIRRMEETVANGPMDRFFLVSEATGTVTGNAQDSIPLADILQITAAYRKTAIKSRPLEDPWFYAWENSGSGKHLIALTAGLDGLDIQLIHILEQQQIMDIHGPVNLFITLGLVSAAVIGIFFVVLRYGTRAQVLTARLSESAKKNAEIMQANKRLAGEIHQRLQAEQNLRLVNESLEERVRERGRELEKIHEQMIIQEKMASVGQLASGIAHELNNPLHFIVMNYASLSEYSEIIADSFEACRAFIAAVKAVDPKPTEYQTLCAREPDLNLEFVLEDMPNLIRESRRGFERMKHIIQSLQDFSYVDRTGDYRYYNINAGITDALVITKNAYKYVADAITDLGAIPEIRCLPEKLNQVFLNLLINSVHAIQTLQRPERGQIFIRTWNNDTHLHCEIADDGPGIPPEIRSRIFEPFFTTKPPGQGTGLGLSICYDIIVEKHHGTLKADCPESGGTVFSISIPVNL